MFENYKRSKFWKRTSMGPEKKINEIFEESNVQYIAKDKMPGFNCCGLEHWNAENEMLRLVHKYSKNN